MASDLMTIAASGARVARASLEVTAQNIANAGSQGYVRRSARIEELRLTGQLGTVDELSQGGARFAGVTRNADPFRQAEARRTAGDATRAATELDVLQKVESALEDTQIHDSSVTFEAALQRLASNPVDASLRSSVLEQARSLAGTFHIASANLDALGESVLTAAQFDVGQFNQHLADLDRINQGLIRAGNESADRVSLLDERDRLLDALSGLADVKSSLGLNGTVEVRLADPSAPPLLDGAGARTLDMQQGPDGAFSFAVDGSAVSLSSGSLAGRAQGRTRIIEAGSRLDAIAQGLIAAMNAAQGSGADYNGAPGQPMFAGGGAADIELSLSSWQQLATAPAGSVAGSRLSGNLDALQGALTGADTPGQVSQLLFETSSLVSGRKRTSEALDAIAQSAATALDAQSGVDLDQEALNLVQFQHAFQASGRVMQVAADLFDSLLAIR